MAGSSSLALLMVCSGQPAMFSLDSLLCLLSPSYLQYKSSPYFRSSHGSLFNGTILNLRTNVNYLRILINFCINSKTPPF